MQDYQFTTDWFSRHRDAWNRILDDLKPARILEIGSFEGRAACHMIARCAARGPLEMHCADTWAGGVEHDRAGMGTVEARFDHNVALAMTRAQHPVAFHKHKGPSDVTLIDLLANGRRGGFDLIYVDGSHQAPDVLADAVLSFKALRVGGVLIFDDYLWSMEDRPKRDLVNMPKPAIDAFLNLYCRKTRILPLPLYQLYVVKADD